MTSYGFALEAHSTLRLLLAVFCALLFVLGMLGSLSKGGLTVTGKLLLLLATIVADLQLLLGLALYFVWSPSTSQARADFGAAMKDPTLRYWAVEHSSAMLLAVVCVHVGKVLVGKATSDPSRHRWTVLWFGIALALIVVMSPWPFSGVARPFWRLVSP
jgi:hypothetical protein